MRTNIDIDDALMADAIKWSGRPTKKAAVEEALRHYVRSMVMRDIIESTRGIGWDDGLGTVERLGAQHTAYAAEEGTEFDGQK